jgi:hypothetical protein
MPTDPQREKFEAGRAIAGCQRCKIELRQWFQVRTKVDGVSIAVSSDCIQQGDHYSEITSEGQAEVMEAHADVAPLLHN